jgi:hypothetical protein
MPYEKSTQYRPSLRVEPLAKPVDRHAEDATGINVEERKPIDSRMPHLPPA